MATTKEKRSKSLLFGMVLGLPEVGNLPNVLLLHRVQKDHSSSAGRPHLRRKYPGSYLSRFWGIIRKIP
jgi:hypothetical protein